MEVFNEQYVQYIDQEHVSWKSMIQMAGQPLLNDGLIAQELLDDPAHKARLWIFLATPDDRSHIELIQKLATLLMDAAHVQRILAATSQEELLASVLAK